MSKVYILVESEYLLSVDGKPIVFLDAAIAQGYCKDMEFGLGRPVGTFTTTENVPDVKLSHV